LHFINSQEKCETKQISIQQIYDCKNNLPVWKIKSNFYLADISNREKPEQKREILNNFHTIEVLW